MLKEDELTFFEEQMENNQEVDRGKFEEHAKKGQAAAKEADKDLKVEEQGSVAFKLTAKEEHIAERNE